MRSRQRTGLSNESLFPERVAKRLKWWYKKLLVCPCTGALYLATLVLALVASWRKRSVAPLVSMAPGVLLWATLMISVPLSVALRYGVFFLFALPVFAGMCTTGESEGLSTAWREARQPGLSRAVSIFEQSICPR